MRAGCTDAFGETKSRKAGGINTREHPIQAQGWWLLDQPATFTCACIGWQRRRKSRLSQREIEIEGIVFFLGGYHVRVAVNLDNFCAGRTFAPHKEEDRIT